jgi:general stress protein YciG
MDSEKQREIARKGGKAAHQKGTAHEFTSDEARAAGRKGGERVSANRAHMAEIGRLGGKRSATRRANPSSAARSSGNSESGMKTETESSEGESNSQQASHHGMSSGARDESM